MIVDFKQVTETVIPHFQGGALSFAVRVVNDSQLAPGASIGIHMHTDTCEIAYVISGTGTSEYGGAVEELRSGSVSYCPQGQAHSMTNTGDEDLIFFAVVPQM